MDSPVVDSSEVGAATVDALYEHYSEMKRWNPKLSLVGPGTAREVVSRHYGEALQGLSLLDSGDKTLVDMGSGGGFPGFVLAAARRDIEVYLVEARERKWAFLKSATRRSRLSCRCLNARVSLNARAGTSLPSGLPERIDLVTCRAVALTQPFFEIVREHSPEVRFLLWQGEDSPDLPAGLGIGRELTLAGSSHRRILEIRSLG